MPKAKVWNEGTTDHVEMFEGEQLRIAPKHYIVMDKSKAVQFMGRMVPLVRDGMGRQVSGKPLRIEVISDDFVPTNVLNDTQHQLNKTASGALPLKDEEAADK